MPLLARWGTTGNPILEGWGVQIILSVQVELVIKLTIQSVNYEFLRGLEFEMILFVNRFSF